jgi:FkbM family methyltransferase
MADTDVAGVIPEASLPARRVGCRGRGWRVLDHPVVAHAVEEFASGFEETTLQFFDAALPFCRRLIDAGGYFGLLSLYAGDRVEAITVFEPSPSHQAILRANLALNPGLGARATLVPAAMGAAAGERALYRKAYADSGASLLRTVERQTIRHGVAEATVPVLAAADALARAGLDADTLLKIDIEGAEYEVIPAIADLLRRHLPFLQISFHPFNLVAEEGGVATDLLRLRRMLGVVEALRAYAYWYVPFPDGWCEVAREDIGGFLEAYLLRPKPVERIATPQYGLVGGVGFSRTRLALPGRGMWRARGVQAAGAAAAGQAARGV